MVPTDAPGMPLDGRQGGVKGSERSMVDAGHGLQSMAIRVDCELLGGCFGDPAHRTAEQVRQVPSLAVIGWGHGDIQACLRFAHCPGNGMSGIVKLLEKDATIPVPWLDYAAPAMSVISAQI